MGLGNGLLLPSLVGAPLAGMRPEQAGVASGMLATTQQFASVTGVAVIGALFFTVLGTQPDRATYATAARLAAWVAVGVIVAMVVLVQILIRAAAAARASAEVAKPAEQAPAAPPAPAGDQDKGAVESTTGAH